LYTSITNNVLNIIFLYLEKRNNIPHMVAQLVYTNGNPIQYKKNIKKGFNLCALKLNPCVSHSIPTYRAWKNSFKDFIDIPTFY